jgi:predicted N-acetyltransferase YhbS
MLHTADLKIRVATLNDRAAMMPAINDAFAIETFMEGTRTDQARLSEMMKAGEFLVALDGAENIVASVYVEVRGTRGYLGMLAVHPREQGKGLGTRDGRRLGRLFSTAWMPGSRSGSGYASPRSAAFLPQVGI